MHIKHKKYSSIFVKLLHPTGDYAIVVYMLFLLCEFCAQLPLLGLINTRVFAFFCVFCAFCGQLFVRLVRFRNINVPDIASRPAFLSVLCG